MMIIRYMSDEQFEQASQKVAARHTILFMMFNDYLFLEYPYVHLKDDLGRVVRVMPQSCYEPDDDGRVCAAVGGFTYFWGHPTFDSVTHAPINHPDLFIRGFLVPVEKSEELSSASPKEVLSAAGFNLGGPNSRLSTNDGLPEETLHVSNIHS